MEEDEEAAPILVGVLGPRGEVADPTGFAEAMKPYEVGTPYPNFIAADEGSARLRSSYGPEKYERLVAFPELHRWLLDGYRVAEEGDGYRLYVGRAATQ